MLSALSYIGNVLRIGVASVFGGHRPLLGHLWEQTDVVSLYGNTLCDFGLSQTKDGDVAILRRTMREVQGPLC